MKPSNLNQLTKYLAVYKIRIAIVLFALSVTAISTLCIGYIFKILIDHGLKEHSEYSINYSMSILVGLILIFAFASFCRSYFINLVAEEVTSKIKMDTYGSLLKTDLAIFEELKIGDIISCLSSDIDNISQLITNFLSFVIRNIVMLVGGIFLMFVQSPKLSMLVIITLPVLLFPLISLSKKVRSLSRSSSANKGYIAASIEESFSGIRDVVSYNRQEYMANSFTDKVDAYLNIAKKRLKFRSMFFALAIISLALSISTVIWIGSLDIISGAMTSGQMISFMYYSLMVGISAGGIAESFSEVQGPLASLERVFDLKAINHKHQTHDVAKNEIDKIGDIIFQNVEFAYPARQDVEVLKDLSFTIHQNKFTAIVGKSGSGKSTIMQLILKFYTKYNGAISISGQEIKDIKSESIRNRIAYVQQDPTIFSGTIRSNILFSNQNANMSSLEKIAEICGIKEFTANLPDGLDTEIGEKGIRLSGGQKQRVAIARALLYNPDLLMLDEATSALDSMSEQKLLNNISNLLAGKTFISIAHRMSATQDADQILVINNGKLVASGTHKSLLKESEIYNILYKEQITL